MTLLFDVETNGLLPELNVIHCLSIYNTDTGAVLSFADQPGHVAISEGIAILEKAPHIAAHNAFEFDIKAIKKVYKEFNPVGKIDDTLVLSRLMFPHLWDLDLEKNKIRSKSYGSHSLDAWGQRLGVLKSETQANWSTWTPEMHEYCIQDALVLSKLWKYLISLNYSEKAIELEYEFAKQIKKQEENGTPFDLRKANVLLETFTNQKEKIEQEAAAIFPLRESKKVIIPKRDNAKKGYRAGVAHVTCTHEPINLGSRVQIIEYFKSKYNWVPKETTEKGNPVLNSEVFKDLSFPEARIVAEYLDVTKSIGQLSEGANALMAKATNGTLYGRVNHNGARSGRCTHFSPNIANIPKTKEFRELFTAPVGKVFVGADLKAIELRMLAHYLHPYDQGHYTKLLLESDIHTANQEAAGLQTRDQAKRFIFAFLYGAGQEMLGSIVRPEGTKDEKEKIGKEVRDNFLAKIPGIDSLLRDVKNAYNHRGYLIGLDGRKLHPRAAYNSLNTLLQGGAAVIAKKWTCLIHEYAADMDILQHIHCHDEIVLSCHETDTEALTNICLKAAVDTGIFFNINLPIEANAKIGLNWHAIH
jgi:DNA polymerase-1